MPKGREKECAQSCKWKHNFGWLKMLTSPIYTSTNVKFILNSFQYYASKFITIKLVLANQYVNIGIC